MQKVINFFKKIFGGCDHEWETVKSSTVSVYDEDMEGNRREFPVEKIYVEIQRCTKCGKIRKQSIKY